jgi:hypothetical protein
MKDAYTPNEILNDFLQNLPNGYKMESASYGTMALCIPVEDAEDFKFQMDPLTFYRDMHAVMSLIRLYHQYLGLTGNHYFS